MSSLVANRGESDEEFARRLQSEDVILSALIRQHRAGGESMGSMRSSFGSGGVRHTGTSSSSGEDEGLIANRQGTNAGGAGHPAGALPGLEGVNNQQQRLNELYMRRIELCVVVTVNIPQILAVLIILTQAWDGTEQSHCDYDHVTRWVLWIALSALRMGVASAIVLTMTFAKEWVDARPNVLRNCISGKNAADLFQLIWFVVGNMWLFGDDNTTGNAMLCPHPGRSPVYRLAVAMLIINYIQICLPCIVAVVMIPVFCFCMPCLIRLVARFHGGEFPNGAPRGATEANIDTLPLVTITEELLREGSGSGNIRNGNSNGGADLEAGGASTSTSATSNGGAGGGGGTGAPAALEAQACPICLSDLVVGEEARLLTCKHLFHRACVDEWLQVNASCPTCRKLIFPPNNSNSSNTNMETEVAGANGVGLEMLDSRERLGGSNDSHV